MNPTTSFYLLELKGKRFSKGLLVQSCIQSLHTPILNENENGPYFKKTMNAVNMQVLIDQLISKLIFQLIPIQ